MKRLIRLLQRLPASLWLYWGFLAGLLFMFALLAEEVVERDAIGFDQAILESLDRWRTPGLDVVAGILNVVGGSYLLAPLTVIVFIVLWRRWPRSAVFVGLAVFGAMALGGLAKLIFERPRPQDVEALVYAEGFSFPSGHAMSSTAVALAAYFSIRALAPVWRWPAFAIGAAFALAVGVSRSYLLVHYPSDVIAGWILATAWVLGVHAATSVGLEGRRGPRSPPPASEASEASEAKPDAASTEARNHHRSSTTISPNRLRGVEPSVQVYAQ